MAHPEAAAALERVRVLCLALPEVTERTSHGAPSWFVRKSPQFAIFHDDHHGDGRLGLWCAAPPAAQDGLVHASPEHFYVPAYVGHRGWVGVRLDRGLPWEDVAAAIEDAYLAVAPPGLAEEAVRRAGG